MLLRFKSLARHLFGSRFTGGGLSILDPAHVSGLGEPRRAKQPPDGYAYIQVFTAEFETQDEAEAFCYDTPTKNTPEQITQELSGAFIDTNFVEVIYGNIGPRLNEFMSAGDSVQIMASLGSDNTVIIISEEAFGGFPFLVHNTKTLTHLGQFKVPV